MSDLFRSALGYLSSSSTSSSAAAGGNNSSSHHYQQQGHSDDMSGVGEVINFTNGDQRRNVRITKMIAEGGFSYVYQGVDLATGEIIAIKKILAPDAESLKTIEQEINFMRQFQHTHIINFYGSFFKSANKNLQEHYIGMEYCRIQLPLPPLRFQHCVQVFAQTCRAVKYLHEFGIIHRDIKLENILIGADGLVKLVDFGSATMEKIYPQADWSMNKRTLVEEQIAQKTTPMYRAPEMLDLWSNYPIDEHSDMWALGCLLFALNFGQHPFQDSNKLAIVNANYHFPKNVSDSGPVVEIIRGLLKVNPADRFSFGQIYDILTSICESEGFALGGQLPFKPANSPNHTGIAVNPIGGPPSQPPPHSHHTPAPINMAAGGGLFNSLKGGAESLFKNIKESSQKYMVGGATQPVNGGSGLSRQGSTSSQPQHHGAPPPRPAPPTHEGKGHSQHLEFENREYEIMQQQQQQHKQEYRAPPPKPPPPKILTAHEEPVANLLDISLGGEETEPTLPKQSPSRPPPPGSGNTADLLGDLFGSSVPNPQPTSSIPSNSDLLWGTNSGSNNSMTGLGLSSNNKNSNGISSQQPGMDDLLGGFGGSSNDPFASLLGKSAPQSTIPGMGGQPNSSTTVPNFGGNHSFLQASTNTLPTSSSFQNLNYNAKASSAGGTGLLDPGTSRIPKNSSSPNLLSDLILDDIIKHTGGMTFGDASQGAPRMNTSNPTLNQPADNLRFGSNGVGGNVPSQPKTQPNYNRHLFENPPAPEKKQTLNDAFGDLLNSQGFSSTSKCNQTNKTINDMRKIEMLSNPNMDPDQIKINEWREGKKKNIRALLSSLHTVTWDGCHWEETNMSQMITHAQVKKTYRKACLAIHPDKQLGHEWENMAKLIFCELNEAWAAFDESQGS